MSKFLIICMLSYPSMTYRTEANHASVSNVEYARFGCAQPVADQAVLMREAETRGYAISRLEFVGNESISDGVLRKKSDLFRRVRSSEEAI